MRVLIIPEDPTNDGALLRPLVKRMVSECKFSNPDVEVLTNPHLRGISQVRTYLPLIVERYSHIDLLICLVDADGKDRSQEFADMEKKGSGKLLCCAAIQEVEIWLLAGHSTKLGATWSQVRKEVSLKETYFEKFLAAHGDHRRPAGGREELMKATLANYRGLKKKCPELQDLEDRIRRLRRG